MLLTSFTSGLGLIVTVFDLIFLSQYYLIYPKVESTDEERARLIIDEEQISIEDSDSYA